MGSRRDGKRFLQCTCEYNLQVVTQLKLDNCMLPVMSEDDRNSHFFQERVLIERIRNSPGKLIVIQVPEVEES